MLSISFILKSTTHMKFKTLWNAQTFPRLKEKVRDSVSATIPDQTMSLEEILYRYRRGLSLDDAKVPIYHEDEEGNPIDLPDLRRLDLAEIQELREDARRRYSALQDAYNRHAAAEREKELQARKSAQQGSTVQRTTGEGADQGTTDQPDPAPRA